MVYSVKHPSVLISDYITANRRQLKYRTYSCGSKEILPWLGEGRSRETVILMQHLCTELASKQEVTKIQQCVQGGCCIKKQNKKATKTTPHQTNTQPFILLHEFLAQTQEPQSSAIRLKSGKLMRPTTQQD